MNATLTELRRSTGKLLSAVLRRNKTVKLTQHGKTVAEIHPRRRALSPDEFARLWKARRPLGEATAADMAATLKRLDASQ